MSDQPKHGERRLRTFFVSIPTPDEKSVLRRVKVPNVPMEWDANVCDWIIETEGLLKIEEYKTYYWLRNLRTEVKRLLKENRRLQIFKEKHNNET